MNQRRLGVLMGFILCVLFGSTMVAPPAGGADADIRSIERIAPEAAKQKLDSGEAIMVCSYDDEHCSRMMIKGAITSANLAAQRLSLPKDQPLIFYCA